MKSQEYFPKDPQKLFDILLKKYEERNEDKISAMDWKIFSGKFNRHLIFLRASSSRRKTKAYILLFALWQNYNRLLSISVFRILEKVKELQIQEMLLKEFRGMVNGIK